MNEKVKKAFIEVRDGRSPEFVICNAVLNEKFLAAARRLGVKASDAEINTELINLRKQCKLIDCRTTRRKKRDPGLKDYQNAVLNVTRLLERQCGKNVDDIICDPQTRSQFDAFMQFMSPKTPAFEAQYAALSLRKSNRLKPEPVGQVIRAVCSSIKCLQDLEEQSGDLREAPGVYIFFEERTTLYAGKADNLRSRITDHASTWTFREMIRGIRMGRQSPVFVVYHQRPVSISAKELAAYETELIRSRQPAHNRAGRGT
jgi:hypothetical protein